MSFSEKYRGTEWGQPEPETAGLPAGAPQPAPRPRAKLPLLIGVVAIALAGVVAWTAFGPGVLRAPAGTEPSPTPSAAAARSTGDVVLQRFRKLVANTNATMRLTFTTSVQGGPLKEFASGTIDIAGRDFSGPVRFKDNKSDLRFQMIQKGSNVYVRARGTGWIRLPAKDAREITRDDSANPFHDFAKARHIRYVGEVTRSGRRLHHLRFSQWLSSDPRKLLTVRGATWDIQKMQMDVYTTARGVPVEGVFDGAMSMTYGGKRYGFVVKASFRFSRVGARIQIKAPRLG